ncbi:MAG: ABC transporter permease [Deltaproteobacteria bacterium]|nr:ABC transporter permease [Deltaproteobacteria bacterium]
MWQYLLRRLLLMIPTFLGITLVCFLVLRLANTDPVVADLEAGLQGQQISQEAIEHLRRIYDLDKPWYVQYARLVGRLLSLDLGTTWKDGRPIAEVIGEALPITVLLSVLSLAIAYLIAIPLGVFSATRQYTRKDQAVTVGVFMLYSLPRFWVGTLLLVFLASGHYLDWFPLQGWHSFRGFEEMGFLQKVGDVAWHITLPLLALTFNAFAALSRYMRSGMLEAIRQDYVRTARAKGVPERVVIWRHALRNSLIPIITLMGLYLPYLIGGSVIVETIFGIRGMGGLTLEAIRMPDYPLVITLVAFTSLLTMVGILLSDILYAVVDPRITYGGESP